MLGWIALVMWIVVSTILVAFTMFVSGQREAFDGRTTLLERIVIIGVCWLWPLWLTVGLLWMPYSWLFDVVYFRVEAWWRRIHEDEAGAVSLETILIIGVIALPVLIFLVKFGWPAIKAFFIQGAGEVGIEI
jgi:hypothetical protein